jgi:hypothetical protein
VGWPHQRANRRNLGAGIGCLMHGPAAMLRLWHAVRHLKFVQVYGRARFRLARPRPDTSPAPDHAVLACADLPAFHTPLRHQQPFPAPQSLHQPRSNRAALVSQQIHDEAAATAWVRHGEFAHPRHQLVSRWVRRRRTPLHASVLERVLPLAPITPR